MAFHLSLDGDGNASEQLVKLFGGVFKTDFG